MAIGKWIPFSSSNPVAAAQDVKPETVQAITSADAKKFGLENVRSNISPVFSILMSSCLKSLAIPGELWWLRFNLQRSSIIAPYSYANSVLQALYFCSPFRELLLQYADTSTLLPATPQPHSLQTPAVSQSNAQRKPQRKYSNAGQSSDAVNANGSAAPPTPFIPSNPTTMVSALRSLFLFISKNPADKGTVAPRAFIEKLKEANELFRSTMHQDAHEFLNYLLNKIVEEIEDERKAGIPDVDDREFYPRGGLISD